MSLESEFDSDILPATDKHTMELLVWICKPEAMFHKNVDLQTVKLNKSSTRHDDCLSCNLIFQHPY